MYTRNENCLIQWHITLFQLVEQDLVKKKQEAKEPGAKKLGGETAEAKKKHNSSALHRVEHTGFSYIKQSESFKND